MYSKHLGQCRVQSELYVSVRCHYDAPYYYYRGYYHSDSTSYHQFLNLSDTQTSLLKN